MRNSALGCGDDIFSPALGAAAVAGDDLALLKRRFSGHEQIGSGSERERQFIHALA